MTEPQETSAGETGGREAMSDERLAEIRAHCDEYGFTGATDVDSVVAELLAEVERQRGEIARGNEEIALLSGELQTERDAAEEAIVDHGELLAERDAATQRAETAERELAEMRDEWGVQRTWSDGDDLRHGYAICETEEHARAALEHYRASDRFERNSVESAVVKRVVGEWKAADGA